MVSPTASRLRSETARQVVAAAVPAGEVEVDQVDRGHAPLEERDVVVQDAAAQSPAGRRAPPPTRLRRRAQPSPEPRRPSTPRAGSSRPLVAHEVEQHHRARVREAPRGDLAAAQAASARTRRRGTPRGLSSPSKKTNWIVWRAARPDRARELGDHGRARRAVVGARRSRGCPSCRSARPRRRSPGSRPRTVPITLRSPPGTAGSGPRGSEPLQQRARAARDVGEPAGRGPSSTCCSSRLQAPRRRRSGRPCAAAWRGRPSASPSSTNGTLSVATSATSARPSTTCTASTDAQQLHRADCGRVGSARGEAGHKDRLSAVDASFLHQEKQSSHMHVGAAGDLRGAAAGARGLHRRSSSRGSHLVPRYRQKLGVPALRDGPPVLGRRPELQPRLPRAPHRAAEARQRRAAAPARRAGSSRSGSTARSRSGRSWLVQGLEGNRFALISKTHHALVDGVSGRGHRDRAVRPLARAGRAAAPTDAWTPAPEPSRRRAGRRGRQGARAHAASSLAGRALGALQRPGRHGRAASREAAEGIGEVVWAGLNPAPDVPLNVPIGPHRRVRWVQSRAGRLQGDQERARRHRERRRARGRVGRARPLAARRAACAPRASSCARSCRSRSAPRTSAARSATGSRRCAGRCPSTRTTRSSACAIVQRGDGRPEGVEAGARRRGDRGAPGLRAADAARPGLAAELLHPALQPDRDQRARAAVPALPARPRDAGDRADRLPAREPRAGDRDHELQRQASTSACSRDYDAMPDLDAFADHLEDSLAELLEAARKAGKASARSNGTKKDGTPGHGEEEDAGLLMRRRVARARWPSRSRCSCRPLRRRRAAQPVRPRLHAAERRRCSARRRATRSACRASTASRSTWT